MKHFRKIYVEITNRCNLQCAFCPGTRRTPRTMTAAEFAQLLPRLQPHTDYLYFHLMGEPLCHPELGLFLHMAGQAGFRVILTTNGTLLPARQELLLGSPALHKVNISLHAFEANDLTISFEDYLDGCLRFGRAAAGEKLVVYRLWNNGGADARNQEILSALERSFPRPWKPGWPGTRLAEQIYLEHGDRFDWPDLSAPQRTGAFSCYGLRDQVGVLCDGTVVPCCLDHEGDIPLGNLFEQPLAEILATPRAQAICRGFAGQQPVEDLCRHCGFAHDRFSR